MSCSSTKLLIAFVLAGSLSALPAFAQTDTLQNGSKSTTSTQASEKSEATLDIIDTAAKAGTFKTLATALKAAGLDQTLKGKGPFTVFAPSDEAFAKLPKGTVEELLKPENKKKLAAILNYHVVSGNVSAKDVMSMESAETVNGESVKIKTVGTTVMVNDAKVIKTDIACKNGTVHVIDTVLMPKS